jgi:hypothetical protein
MGCVSFIRDSIPMSNDHRTESCSEAEPRDAAVPQILAVALGEWLAED